MRQNSEQDFIRGLDILKPFFDERDFELRTRPPFSAEEGTFYSAQFVWGNHTVTLIHLFGPSQVTYSIGATSMEHGAYLDALGVRMAAAYPTDAEDPAADYEALLSDLEDRLAPFFEEPDREFMELASTHGQKGRPWLPGA